jgi:acyl carrier protein
MKIEDAVRSFIIEKLHGPPQQLTSDFPLIDRGVVDSLGIFRLVTFLEGTYGIKIEDEELAPEYFDTIRSIATLVESKVQGVR